MELRAPGAADVRPAPAKTAAPVHECDHSDPATGECCTNRAPFGFGPPALVTTIHACASHRGWAEAIFRERKNG